jgi:hypothetical protein
MKIKPEYVTEENLELCVNYIVELSDYVNEVSHIFTVLLADAPAMSALRANKEANEARDRFLAGLYSDMEALGKKIWLVDEEKT